MIAMTLAMSVPVAWRHVFIGQRKLCSAALDILDIDVDTDTDIDIWLN